MDTRGPSGNWRTTKAGLILIMICTIAALAVWWMIGAAFFFAEFKWIDGWGAGFLIIGLALFAPPALVLAAFIGVCLCCTAPDPLAKKRAGITTYFFAGPLVVVALAFMGIIPDGFESVLVPGLLLGSLIGATVFWCFFHAAVAGFFHNASLRTYSILTMTLTLANFCLFALLAVFHDAPSDDWFQRTLDVVMAWYYLLPILVSNTIILVMNLALCMKSIKIIKQGTTTTS